MESREGGKLKEEKSSVSGAGSIAIVCSYLEESLESGGEMGGDAMQCMVTVMRPLLDVGMSSSLASSVPSVDTRTQDGPSG